MQKTTRKIDKGKDLSEIPKSQKRSKPKTLQQYDKKAGNRNQVIQKSYASGGYYGLHCSRISRIINESVKAKLDLRSFIDFPIMY